MKPTKIKTDNNAKTNDLAKNTESAQGEFLNTNQGLHK